MPKVLIGNDYYYLLRYIDAENRGLNPPDYYLDYGNKYMNKFKYETGPSLSTSGQECCRYTLYYLQANMENILLLNSLSDNCRNNYFTGLLFFPVKSPDFYCMLFQRSGENGIRIPMTVLSIFKACTVRCQ